MLFCHVSSALTAAALVTVSLSVERKAESQEQDVYISLARYKDSTAGSETHCICRPSCSVPVTRGFIISGLEEAFSDVFRWLWLY